LILLVTTERKCLRVAAAFYGFRVRSEDCRWEHSLSVAPVLSGTDRLMSAAVLD
jgi:hypothetical protein